MRRYLFVVVLFVAVTLPAAAQTPTPAEIEAFIGSGLRGGAPPTSDCYASGSMLDTNGFDVTVIGPLGRVMRRAGEAKAKYQPFTAADVDAEMIAPVLTVTVSPTKPTLVAGTWTLSPFAEHVVIAPKGAKGGTGVIQPLDVTPFHTDWSNALGAKWDGQGVVAHFDLAAFRAIAAPELDVIVVGADRSERRCKIGKKDRAALK